MPGWPIAAALAVLFLFLYHVRVVLLPFIVAAAISFIMSPLVERLRASVKPLPRWVAALAIYLLVLALLGVLGYWWVPLVVADLSDFLLRAPELIHRLFQIVAPSGHLMLLGTSYNADALAQSVLAGLRGFLLSSGSLSLASAGIGAVLGLVLTVVLLAYFLISGPSVARGVLWLVPPEYRDEVRRLGVEVAPVLRRYFVGLVVIVAYASFISSIAFTVTHVPHAPLLALMVGFLELIPVLGPILSIVLICLAAVEQSSVVMMVSLAMLAPVLRLSVDQVIGPLILGRAAYLHPVAIIFAFLSGAVFLGILGLVLAVPVAATIKIVLSYYYRERVVPS